MYITNINISLTYRYGNKTSLIYKDANCVV